MVSYTEKNIDLFSFHGTQLQATFYKPNRTEMRTLLLYFHGGGFVFGYRKDLPKSYIELFTSAGIGMIAVDYPLAPETKLPTLLETTHKMMTWFTTDFLTTASVYDYFILGRSAGGFLALANGLYATRQLSIPPRGIISLYGYFNLNEASFSVPNRHYLKYPKVNDKLLATLTKEEPFLGTTDPNRFLIYLAARQKGNWPNLFLSDPKQKSDLSITKKALSTLPPLFIAAAEGDPDVPVRQSKQLANSHPKAILQLFEVDDHDFDRVHENTLGHELYKKIISWILDNLS